MFRIVIDFIENRATGGLRLALHNRGAQSVGTAMESNAAIAFFRDLRDSFRGVEHRTVIHKEDASVDIHLPPNVVRHLYRAPKP